MNEQRPTPSDDDDQQANARAGPPPSNPPSSLHQFGWMALLLSRTFGTLIQAALNILTTLLDASEQLHRNFVDTRAKHRQLHARHIANTHTIEVVELVEQYVRARQQIKNACLEDSEMGSAMERFLLQSLKEVLETKYNLSIPSDEDAIMAEMVSAAEVRLERKDS
jgi:hypothetical protein